MTIREFLNSCRDAVDEIRSLERQREAVRIPMGPTTRSASIVEMASRDNDPTTTALNAEDYYDQLLKAKIEEQKQLLMQLEDMLSMLRAGKERTVMRYYFARGWTYTLIAEELNIDEKTVERRRWRATQYLERKFPVAKKCP